MKKGTVILVTPGKSNIRLLESEQPWRFPSSIYQLFIVDGIPITRFMTSLILRAESRESITILHAKNPIPWHTAINDLWSTSKPGQVIVVVIPNADLFRVAVEIIPTRYRPTLESYHPSGEIFISTNGNGEFEMIT